MVARNLFVYVMYNHSVRIGKTNYRMQIEEFLHFSDVSSLLWIKKVHIR